MDAVRSDGTEFPVSVWMKGVKTEDEPRVIVVVEPVARANAHFTLNPPTKEILACDENFATLFGYLEPHEVVGKRITDFVPSVVIPEIIGNEDETLQQLTGRSKANTVFPLTVTFTAKECPQANTEDDDRVQGMHVCMYLHMYIHTYIRFIRTYIRIYSMYVCTYICMYVRTRVCMGPVLHMYVHTYIHTYICAAETGLQNCLTNPYCLTGIPSVN